MLVSWDIDVIEQFKGADLVGTQEYLREIWEVAMCLTVTLAWFTLPVMISCLACRCHSATTVFGVFLLILGGPNMMVWNVIGCIVGALKFSEFCFTKSDCDMDFMVLTMKVGTWALLYLISAVCLYGLYSMVKNFFSDLRLHNRMKRWRNTKKLGDVLLDTACSICLDNMRVTLT
jgi:hypothetical protein